MNWLTELTDWLNWLFNIGWPFNTGLTNMRVIQENEGSQRVKYLSHDKLTSTCFYPFLAQKKKVKDHLTPYTVRPVALVRYFSNNSLGPRKRCLWPLNTGDCLIKVSFTVFIKGNDFRDFRESPLNRGWLLNRGPFNTCSNNNKV